MSISASNATHIPVELKTITAADLEFVRMLRNTHRRWFRDSRPIEVDRQAAWFAWLEQRSDLKFFVLHCRDARIGTLSLTECEGAVEVGNLALIEEFRGQRVMFNVLRRLIDPAQRYVARVKPDNERSLRLFQQLNFIESGRLDDGDLVWLVRSPELGKERS